MGRKGVSKRKPKTKSKPVSNAETNAPPARAVRLFSHCLKTLEPPLTEVELILPPDRRKTEKENKVLGDVMMFIVLGVREKKRQ